MNTVLLLKTTADNNCQNSVCTVSNVYQFLSALNTYAVQQNAPVTIVLTGNIDLTSFHGDYESGNIVVYLGYYNGGLSLENLLNIIIKSDSCRDMKIIYNGYINLFGSTHVTFNCINFTRHGGGLNETGIKHLLNESGIKNAFDQLRENGLLATVVHFRSVLEEYTCCTRCIITPKFFSQHFLH